MKRRGKGFTLIELLVVMAIVALLSSVALPRYIASAERAKETALKENLKAMRVSLDRFRADKGRWPKRLEELVEQRYLSQVPLDPMTEQTDTWIVEAPRDAEEEGVADVKSGASGTTSDGRRYASF